MREKVRCIIWEHNVKRKSKKYLYGWTPCFNKVLQNKQIRLNKNKKLHWQNWFEEIFGPLKALSLGTLLFNRAQGKFFYSTSNFQCQKLEVEQKNLCSTSHGALKHKARGFHERPKFFCSASNFWSQKLKVEQKQLHTTFHGTL